MSNAVPRACPRTGKSVPVLIAGVVVLSFLVGTAVVELDLFPYPQFLKRAYQSLRFQFGETDADWFEDGRYSPCRTTATGVTRRSADAFPGYTLLLSCKGSGATLVDIDGREVHHWQMPFYRAWPEPKHLSELVPEENIFSVHAHLFSNGDLLLNYTAIGVTPYGYGLVKIDKDSKLIWSYPARVHHVFDVADDGTIYALTHEYRNLTDEDRPPQLTVDTILEDFVVGLSPSGQELWKISLFDAIARSREYQSLATAYNGWDLLHTNSVRVITEDFARHHEFCRAGQLFISMRNSDTLAVLDPQLQQITWATRGFWKQQHSPIFVKKGRLMVFDNLGFASRGEPLAISRVVEFDPSTNQIFWDYHGRQQAPFYTKFHGYQQVLPNGNVLITESNRGRVFEVTADRNIAWEYYTPERIEYEGQECAWFIPFAQRYSLEECQFLKP